MSEKVYKRTFRAITEKEMTTLVRRAKLKKYGFREHWFEVEEVTGKPHTLLVNRRPDKKSYFDVNLFYKL